MSHTEEGNSAHFPDTVHCFTIKKKQSAEGHVEECLCWSWTQS